MVAGEHTDLPVRCRFGWHRWSKWGVPVGLLGKRWNPIVGAYSEESIIQQQASVCADCNAFRTREVKE
jgi:hypothetical protein